MADNIVPQPVSPADGAATDGAATTLSWSPVHRGNYRVQVSASDRFDALILDAETGSAREFTVFGMLPSDGRRVYWRVATVEGGDSGAWSEPAWFLASDVADVRPPPRRDKIHPIVTGPPETGAAASTPVPGENVPLYMQAVTGRRETAVAALVLLATVILLTFLLA